MQTLDPTTRELATLKLHQAINRGAQQAGPTINRVLGATTEDRVTRVRDLGVEVIDKRAMIDGTPLHAHATSQLSERLGIPQGFMSSLVAGESWSQSLAQTILREHVGHSSDRVLLRSVAGQTRAVLSDRFRRLDSRPLLDAFIGAAKEQGAIPYDGAHSDLRSTVRCILPRISEPVEGELMVFGMAWSNSDFGHGAYGLSVFALRLVCLNGMVGSTLVKQHHIGSRLADDLQYSQRTYELDTRATASAAGDIVKKYFGADSIAAQEDQIRQLYTEKVDPKREVAGLKSLTKAETRKVLDAYQGSDTQMMPAGQTKWRFANALSWVANSTEDADRKIELQQAAGKYLQH